MQTQSYNNISYSNKPILNTQAETFIQLQSNCPLPAILFEVTSDGFPGWDFEDLENFFKEVGEIQLIHSNKNHTLIIYYRYYDAYIAIEFFKNPQNFKDETYKDKFKISWLNYERDLIEFPEDIVSKVKSIKDTIPMYSNSLLNEGQSSYQGNQNKQNGYNRYNDLRENISMNSYTNIHGSNTPINKYSMINSSIGMTSPNMNYNYQNYPMTPNPNWNNNGYVNNNNRQISNFNSGSVSSKYNTQNQNDEEGNKGVSGKYTCRFELQIENDKDFQVARKLIGAKGCNMKKIVELCGGSTDNDVKLRLRGQGSGFKEGPMNKESDDPLHLCISSKNPEKYTQACGLVEDLVNNVFEEYKRFCQKYNKVQVSKLVVKKEEGLALKLPQNGQSNITTTTTTTSTIPVSTTNTTTTTNSKMTETNQNIIANTNNPITNTSTNLPIQNKQQQSNNKNYYSNLPKPKIPQKNMSIYGDN